MREIVVTETNLRTELTQLLFHLFYFSSDGVNRTKDTFKAARRSKRGRGEVEEGGEGREGEGRER